MIDTAQDIAATVWAVAPQFAAALWRRLASPAGCTVVIAGVLVLAIICRFAKMTRHTSNSVALQYLLTLAGTLGSLGLYLLPEITLGYEIESRWVLAPMLGGQLLNLMISARRWAQGVPAELERQRPYWLRGNDAVGTWL